MVLEIPPQVARAAHQDGSPFAGNVPRQGTLLQLARVLEGLPMQIGLWDESSGQMWGVVKRNGNEEAMPSQQLTCKGIYDWELDWEGRSCWAYRVIRIHSAIEDTTPRCNHMRVFEIIWIVSLFLTMNVMTVKRISYPQNVLATNKWNVSWIWSLIFGASVVCLSGLIRGRL